MAKSVAGNIVASRTRRFAICCRFLNEAGYGPEHVVRCGVWLEDPRDFSSFNAVFREHFGEHPPARACVVSSMVVDCKVEIDCVAYKAPKLDSRHLLSLADSSTESDGAIDVPMIDHHSIFLLISAFVAVIGLILLIAVFKLNPFITLFLTVAVAGRGYGHAACIP